MPLTTEDQLTIEKSPAYFHSLSAAERIRSLNPAMKIIVVVREPVMRAISGTPLVTHFDRRKRH